MSPLQQSSAGTMQQWILDFPGAPLRLVESEIPKPGPGQLLLDVSACAICEIDPLIQSGDVSAGQYPLVPGHEIIGYANDVGDGVEIKPGQRIGVAWQGGSCGQCWYCSNDLNHLCDEPRYMGRHLNGGYASHVLVDAAYCFVMDEVRVDKSPDPELQSTGWSEDAAMAPLLCEGSLAFRSYTICRNAGRIGLYGFGTAAQLICQIAKAEGHEVYAMSRPGGESLLALARTLGADWTGTVEQSLPELVDSAILFQPTVELVAHALTTVRHNGSLVFLGMHASRVPAFPYDLFSHEHSIHSVSRASRADIQALINHCSGMTLTPRIRTYPFLEANRALSERPNSRHGESVLVMHEPGNTRPV